MRVVVLRIPEEYSLSHTLITITHTAQRDELDSSILLLIFQFTCVLYGVILKLFAGKVPTDICGRSQAQYTLIINKEVHFPEASSVGHVPYGY